MAFNGSGTFVRVHDWTTDKTNTVPVTASRMDAEDDGFADGLSNTICRDGQSTTSARIPFASGTSAAAGSVSAAAFAQTNDLNTGLYFPATDQWGLTAGGVGTLTSSATALTGGSGITLTLSGALTVSSGGYAITGNSTVTGTLGVSSDFAVATNKFTVAAASGNTAVAGTLDVTGAATLSSTLAAAATTLSGQLTVSSGGAAITGNSTITGTLGSVTDFTASGAISGATVTGNMMATAAEQVTGTATDQIVSPGVQHQHASAAKAWAKFQADGTVLAGYNITSVTQNSTGDWTVTIANDFSSANYAVLVTPLNSTVDGGRICHVRTQAAGSFTIKVFNVSGTDVDPDALYVACFGTLA